MPFSPFEWAVSIRYLRSRRHEGFISAVAGISFLGIVLGVATMILVMAVMNGFRNELMDKFLGVNGHIVAYPFHPDFSGMKEAREQISAVGGVKTVIPFVEGAVLISTPQRATGALVRGVEPDDLPSLSTLSENIRLGSTDRFGVGKGVLLGWRLARGLGISVGDRVTLMAPRGTPTPFGVTPRVLSYEVLALFELGVSEYDSTLIFAPLDEAVSFFGGKNAKVALEVKLNNPDDVSIHRERVEHAAGDHFYLVDWRERNRSLFTALEVERNVMFLILTQIILVATLNIIASLVLLVRDKEMEIGLLRAMGATRGAVMRIFFIVGASIGVVGTLIGLCIGLLLCWKIDRIQGWISTLTGAEFFSSEVYYLSRLPADLDAGETLLIVIMSLFLSCIATLYPSWRAACLNPVEVLRRG